MRCPYPLLPSHQHLLSCEATLGAAICLDCVTLPPSVREPWGASRHTGKVRVAYGIKERKERKKVGGVGLIEEERKGSEGGRGSMDKGKRGKMGRWWLGGGEWGGERDLRAHPALIKEPSP